MTLTPEEQARNYLDRIIELNSKFARLDQRVDGLEQILNERMKTQSRELESLRREAKETNQKLDSLLKIVDGSRFTWKTVTFVGSVMAAIVAGLAWVSKNIGPFFG